MSEPSFTHKLSIWSHRLKVENKKKDQYLEVVTIPETGEILHYDSGSLKGHQGHGSAKKIGTKKNDGSQETPPK
jgi:hypothetical protein